MQIWRLMTQNLIGRKPCTKYVVLKSEIKVCELWLPRYFRYSIEAKWVESIRMGGNTGAARVAPKCAAFGYTLGPVAPAVSDFLHPDLEDRLQKF